MKAWRIVLTFASGATFSSVEHENTLALAIESAVRYARACGWGLPVKKRAEMILEAA